MLEEGTELMLRSLFVDFLKVPNVNFVNLDTDGSYKKRLSS